MNAPTVHDFPKCIGCGANAGHMLTTHAPMCFECASSVDWSRSCDGVPPDVAATLAALKTSQCSAAFLTRHAQRLLIQGAAQ